MVSSFGAEAAVLLHMVADIDRDLPVLMINSLMLFEETLDYQRTLARHLGLTNVQHLQPGRDRPRAARSRRHAAPARHRRLLRDPQGRAARPGAAALAGDDHRAQALPGATRGGARGVRGRRRAAAGQSAGALVGAGPARLHGRATTCRGIRWSPGASSRSAAGPAPRRWPRARTSAPAAGAAATRSSAASISAPTAASCGRRAER